MEKSVVDELVAIFGKENVLTANEDMIAYSYDAAHVEVKPEAVVFPTQTEQVGQLMISQATGTMDATSSSAIAMLKILRCSGSRRKRCRPAPNTSQAPAHGRVMSVKLMQMIATCKKKLSSSEV